MKQKILAVLMCFLSVFITLIVDNTDTYKEYQSGIVLDKWLSTETIGKKTYTHNNLKVQFEEYAEDLRVNTTLYKNAQIKGKVTIEKRSTLTNVIVVLGYISSVISGLAVLALFTNKIENESSKPKSI